MVVKMNEIPILENTCTHCSGRGVFSDFSEEGFVNCHKCRGTGYIPTEAGLQVISLIRHASKVRIEAKLSLSSQED